MNQNQPSTMALKLRRIREHLGKSRPTFALMLGIPATTLKNYELGYREGIPATLLQAMFSHPALGGYLTYMLDESQPVDAVGGLKEAA